MNAFDDDGHFTFRWVTWPREVRRQFGVCLVFDEKNNLIQIVDVPEIGLAVETKRRFFFFFVFLSFVFF